ncbi:MauE/DoxX family redox-associated membrane protein [Streptomyces sp. NPDC003038]|uniref:MauE/DoxX family redox-associated membrane protein n=1 Tax=unclassified Streptomyces TaxID=2593676 RepID=UPI0033BE22BA
MVIPGVVYGWVGIRAALAVVFVVAVVSKVRPGGWGPFRTAVGALVPAAGRGATPLAVLVVVVEGAVAVLLAWPWPPATVAGLALAVCALTGFTTAVVAGVRRGDSVPCH